MKRTASVGALVMMLVTALAGAPATAVPNHVKEDRQFFASWTVPTGKPHRSIWLGIDFMQDVERAADHDSILVNSVKGTCVRKPGKGMSCQGSGKGIWDFKGDYTFAPDASSASVEFKLKGKTYSAELTAGDPIPGWFQSFEGCFTLDGDGNEEEGEGQGGGIFRDAEASGTFADAPVEGKNFFSHIMSGVMVSECEPWPMQKEGNNYTLHLPAASAR